MLMYADDTTLYCNIDQHVHEDDINVEFAKLSEWLGANKLALNISKTKFVDFHTSNRAVKYPSIRDRYCASHSITFNVNKSVCMFFKSSVNKDCDYANVCSGGNHIEFVRKKNI